MIFYIKLYLSKYSFRKYCDKIAYNYSHKLPLIFGKWKHLTRTLRALVIYNFGVILQDDTLFKNESSSSSVITGGNKEIFQGIRTILQYNNILMKDLVNAGMEVLKGYFSIRGDSDASERLKYDVKFNKINPLCAMLEEIIILLNPLWYRYPRLSLITFTTLDPYHK